MGAAMAFFCSRFLASLRRLHPLQPPSPVRGLFHEPALCGGARLSISPRFSLSLRWRSYADFSAEAPPQVLTVKLMPFLGRVLTVKLWGFFGASLYRETLAVFGPFFDGETLGFFLPVWAMFYRPIWVLAQFWATLFHFGASLYRETLAAF